MLPRWRALELIVIERQRQDKLKADGRFKYTCADLEMTLSQKVAVLTEEVGEVARATLEINALVSRETDDHTELRHALRKELVQVAAISLAWIESLVEE